MANAFDAVLEAINTMNTGMAAYDRMMEPRVRREAVKLQNQIKIELDDFSRGLESIPYTQYQQAWDVKKNAITKTIQTQNNAVQNVLSEWWDGTVTDYQMGLNNVYHQQWKAGELIELQEEIERLSEVQNREMAMSSIRDAIEASHAAGIIDAETAYRVTEDAIGRVKYQDAKDTALEMAARGEWQEAYEYALLGDNGLNEQRRAALRSELGQIRADRDAEIQRNDIAANDAAASLAEQIIDGERPMFQMDALIESDNRMSGKTRLYWRNWIYARKMEMEKEASRKEEDIGDVEMEQTRREILNTVLEMWNENGYQDEQKKLLDVLRVNDYITKNEWDDYMGTIKGDPIQDPGYKDGFDWINRNLDPDDPETFKIKEAYRRKALENRTIAGQLNKNRWSGQEYVQLAQNLARGEIVGKIFKADQFSLNELFGKWFFNPVEETIYRAQRGDYMGLTEESAAGFLQIETGQRDMLEKILGGEPEKITRNRTGLPEFHWRGRKFMFLIPVDEKGNPLEKDEGLYIYMGENQTGGERWEPVDIEELQKDLQSEVLRGVLRELHAIKAQVGQMWPSTAKEEIRRIAEKNGLSVSLVAQAAKDIGLVETDFHTMGDMADQMTKSIMLKSLGVSNTTNPYGGM